MILSLRNKLQDNVVTNSGRRISCCENTVGHGQCSAPSYSESNPVSRHPLLFLQRGLDRLCE